MKVLCFIITLSVVCRCNALTDSICQETPEETYCLIDYKVRDLWRHELRYVFDWETKRCFEIRWSRHCPHVEPFTNNFASETECMVECGRWA